MNADLHSHSIVSDGLLTPTEVTRRAAELGVELYALTDHDDIRGLAEARTEAERTGMGFINGVEISVTWEGTTLHIVGLNIDADDKKLNAGLASIREGRCARAKLMADDLAQVGVPDCLEGAYKYVSNKEMIGRTHFARFLVESGTVPDVKAAFKKYLVKGKPGYIHHDWASLEDAVDWIRGAGGIAVIAHPGRYKLGANPMRKMVGAFRDMGGQAIEVVTGNHTEDQVRYYASMAKNFGLAASRGSDFHGPGESYALPGKIPPLPLGLKPVWELWQ